MTYLFISWAFPPMQYPRAIQVERLTNKMRVPTKVFCSGKGENIVESDTLSIFRLNRPTWKEVVNKVYYKLISKKQDIPDEQISWAKMIADYILKNHEFKKNDVLVTFGQPMSDHIAGLFIKSKTSVPWVAHFSDPWVDNPFVTRNDKSLALNKKMQHDVIYNADGIIFTSKETQKLVMRNYPKTWVSKCYVLPHAFDSSLYYHNDNHQSNDKYIIRCLGNFYGKRTPVPLIKAIHTIWNQNPEVLNGMKFEIYGVIEKSLMNKLDNLILPENMVNFFSPVDYQESLKLMVESDLLLVIDAPFEYSVFLPSKLIDYIGSRKPIFGITPPGASATLITELGGAVADPNFEDEVVKQLTHVLEKLRLNKTYDTYIYEKIRSIYDINHVASEFKQIIKGIQSQR